MPFCIIDSVSSIRSNYEKTVALSYAASPGQTLPPGMARTIRLLQVMGAQPFQTSSRPLRCACKTDTRMRRFLQIASGHRRGAESSKLMQFTVLLVRFLAQESTGPAIYEMLPD